MQGLLVAKSYLPELAKRTKRGKKALKKTFLKKVFLNFLYLIFSKSLMKDLI